MKDFHEVGASELLLSLRAVEVWRLWRERLWRLALSSSCAEE